MGKTAKRNYYIFLVVTFFRFFGDAFFYSILVRYFDTLGYSSIKLGVLIFVIPFMAVIGNTVLSKIATSQKSNIIILLTWTVIESTFIMAFGFVHSYWAILIFDILCNFCSNSFYNLLDTFALKIVKKADKTYASARVFGTIAYVLSTFAVGTIIDSIGFKNVFLLGGGLMLLAGLLFLTIKFDKVGQDQEEMADEAYHVTYKELLKNKQFVFYMVFLTFCLGTYWAADNIYILYTGYLGVTDKTFSYFNSAAEVTEVLTLLSCLAFKTIKAYKFFLYGAIVSIIARLIIFAIPGMNTYVYLSAELLRGVTYGMILAGNINFLSYILGKRYFSKGFFLAVAVEEMYAGILNLAGPTLASNISFTFVFVLLAALTVISLVFLSLIKIKKPDIKPQSVEVRENNKA
jgi:PPP family 3-phenylpropionic acid transporter